MREEEMSEVHYVLKYGDKVLHAGNVKVPEMLPIEIGRHPNVQLSITQMVEEAVKKGLDQQTQDGITERLRMISRNHMTLLKHAPQAKHKGYLLTSHGANQAHLIFHPHGGGETEAPLRQHDQIPGIDATKVVEIHFPKPFEGTEKLLVLRLKIEEPTH
ncbi:hypothetical protein H0O03_01090 [Candidatus Micrarchaeota archaeon]|nr:hypothetical protein [Candidatus Micrarchaeota archaeon]